MPGQRSGAASGEQPRAPGANAIRARVQELVDGRPSDGGASLEWAVQAQLLGDMHALAMLSLRSGHRHAPDES